MVSYKEELPMKLTVLGNNGPYPSPGGACSGYLLEEKGIKILVDCGSGVLSNLQKFAAIGEIDAVILTHLHNDHMSDMLVLEYAIDVGKSRGMNVKTLDVWAPPEPELVFARLQAGNAFNIRPVEPDIRIEMGDLEITFKRMRHPVLCYGISFANGKKRFVYSGDTGWDPELTEFFKGSDVLLLDAGLLSRDKTDNAPHMTSEECGIAAANANAGKLLLTHLWPGYRNEEIEAEASKYFPGAEAVSLLQQIDIG